MLSFFLVILLALRGLAGDAMAMDLLPTQVASVGSALSGQHRMGHDAPARLAALSPGTALAGHGNHGADLPGYAPLTRADLCAADSASPSCDHGAPCATCAVCHAAAPPRAALPPTADALPQPQPVSAPVRFASALLLRASKPPIA